MKHKYVYKIFYRDSETRETKWMDMVGIIASTDFEADMNARGLAEERLEIVRVSKSPESRVDDVDLDDTDNTSASGDYDVHDIYDEKDASHDYLGDRW